MIDNRTLDVVGDIATTNSEKKKAPIVWWVEKPDFSLDGYVSVTVVVRGETTNEIQSNKIETVYWFTMQDIENLVEPEVWNMNFALVNAVREAAKTKDSLTKEINQLATNVALRRTKQEAEAVLLEAFNPNASDNEVPFIWRLRLVAKVEAFIAFTKTKVSLY